MKRLLALILLCALSCEGATLYVTNSAGFETAQTAASSGDTIYVRGGTYLRTNTLALTKSGLTWKGYPGETAVISGGKAISGWAAYSGNIYRADISSQGFSDRFGQLFFNGVRQTMARYPNYNGIGTNSYNLAQAGTTSQITYKAGDIHTYSNVMEATVNIFPGDNWANKITGITGVNTNTHIISINPSTSQSVVLGNRWFIQGLMEELDVAGEWYLDGNARYLYFYPSNSLASSTVYAPVVTNLITVSSGVTGLTIQNLTLQFCEGAAIVLNNTTNCLVAANIVRQSGNYNESGIVVSGGKTNAVVGNDVYQVGCNGITISGGVSDSLTTSGNYADNNYVHDVGVTYKAANGIDLQGVGNRASRNQINDVPRRGIYFWGQNLAMQSNHIYNAVLETEDVGGIYSSDWDWTADWGSVIDRNYIHDCESYGFYSANGTYGVKWMGRGIQLDFVAHGVTMRSNIIANCHGDGILINGGSENHITNNVIYCCQSSTKPKSNFAPISFFGFLTNSSEWTSEYAGLLAGYNSINQAIWTFPGITVSPADLGPIVTFSNSACLNLIYSTNVPEWVCSFFYQQPWIPQNTIQSNSYFYTGYYGYIPVYTNSAIITFAQWQAAGFDAGSITNDPLMQADFSLATNSPALALGIQSLSTNGIGCYLDSLRASWPLGSPNPYIPPSPPPNLAIASKLLLH